MLTYQFVNVMLSFGGFGLGYLSVFQCWGLPCELIDQAIHGLDVLYYVK